LYLKVRLARYIVADGTVAIAWILEAWMFTQMQQDSTSESFNQQLRQNSILA